MIGLLWCQGGDDLFEARIAAQRVPKRQQLQFAIAELTRKLDGDGELFAGEIVVANPGGNSCQRHDHARAVGRIFFDGKQLNRAAALAERFVFSSQGSVDQTKHAKGTSIVRMGANEFLLFRVAQQ